MPDTAGHIDRLGLEGTRHDISTKARSLAAISSVVRYERHARLATEWAKLQEDQWALLQHLRVTSRGFHLRPRRGVTPASRLVLLKEHHFETTSAVDGVGKKVASQGVPVRIFDPDLGSEGDLSDARVPARLKRDARSKVLAAMLLPPMASGRAASWGDSSSRTADTPWRTGTVRGDQTEKPNAIAKSLLHLARQLTHLKVPWCLIHPELSRLFYTAGVGELTCSSSSGGHISFDCCAFGSAMKGSLTAVFYGLDAGHDGLAHRCERQPGCRYTHLHQWKGRHGSAWNVVSPSLAARIACLLTSDASARMYNRLGAGNTYSPTLPHQPDALRNSVLSGVRSCQHRLGCESA